MCVCVCAFLMVFIFEKKKLGGGGGAVGGEKKNYYRSSLKSFEMYGEWLCFNLLFSGYYCPVATSNYTDYACPTGHYCPLGTQWWNQYPCDAGSYNNLTERTKPGDCLSCPGQWSSVFLVLLCVHMSYSCPLRSSSLPSYHWASPSCLSHPVVFCCQ